MITLDAEFEKSNGRKQHLRLKDFDASKKATEIKSSLGKLTKLSVFEKEGVNLFETLKHATMIERIETPIFDKNDEESIPELEAQTISQVHEPVQNIAAEHIRIPEDLVVTEERVDPDKLIQTITLPEAINPRELTEQQAMIILTACMPANTTLLDIRTEDTEKPAKIILTEKIIQAAEVSSLCTASPPEKTKKKRKRLLDRIRKRE